MGLSASQARLLSITARISDNELHTQQIANAKVRLADQSQEASREYVNALDTQKLVYTMYDAKGNSTQVNLTPAVMYDFSEIKNQYGISNNAGQLLISSTDAKHYENSSDLLSFLHSYNVKMKHNDQYDEMLEVIYGERTDLHDSRNKYKFADLSTYDTFTESIKKLQNQALSSSATIEDYKNYAAACKAEMDKYTTALRSYGFNGTKTFTSGSTYATIDGINKDLKKDNPDYVYGGAFSSYIESLYKAPKVGISCPDYATMCPTEKPDLWDYVGTLLEPVCWEDTHITQLRAGTQAKLSTDEIEHIEHVLAQYTWTTGYGAAETITTTFGDITNNTGANTGSYGTSLWWGLCNGGASNNPTSSQYKPTLAEVDPKGVQNVLNINDDEHKKLKKDLYDLYYQVLLYTKTNNSTYSRGLTGGSITQKSGLDWSSSENTWSAQKISEKYLDVFDRLIIATANDIIEAGQSDPRYTPELENYQDQLKQYTKEQNAYKEAVIKYGEEVADFIENATSWYQSVEYYQDNYKNLIDKIPDPEIIDETDPKVAWYTNLWHRINGASDYKSSEGENGQYWQVLDDANLKSASWLKYQLEQGLVTFEQVQKVDETETNTGLTTTKWQSKAFTTCVDIQFVDDETAVARAEAIYTKKLNEIEAKDKKYDSDIKKLDTEHNALQTEYESVKSVIDKNIERSFKAFS